MGCSNTKAFPNAAGLDNSDTLNNTMNVLNSIDPSKVIEEGEKIINQSQDIVTDEGERLLNQAQEIIEKSAAALESVISGKLDDDSADSSENQSTDLSKTNETIPEGLSEEESAEVEVQEVEAKSEEIEAKSEEVEAKSEEVEAESVEPTAEETAAESSNAEDSSEGKVEGDNSEKGENDDASKETAEVLEESGEKSDKSEKTEPETDSNEGKDPSATEVASTTEEVEKESTADESDK